MSAEVDAYMGDWPGVCGRHLSSVLQPRLFCPHPRLARIATAFLLNERRAIDNNVDEETKSVDEHDPFDSH